MRRDATRRDEVYFTNGPAVSFDIPSISQELERRVIPIVLTVSSVRARARSSFLEREREREREREKERILRRAGIIYKNLTIVSRGAGNSYGIRWNKPRASGIHYATYDVPMYTRVYII